MATTIDIIPITPAMLAMAWVKPATVFNTGAGETNATSDYTPRTLAEQAGARGVGTAVLTDPNYTFARTMKAGRERTPYPVALPNDITSSDVVVAVECTPTLSVPSDPLTGQEDPAGRTARKGKKEPE